MGGVTRREFLRWMAATATGVVATETLGGCGSLSSDLSPSGSVTAGSGPEREILRNENVPGFYVRYYEPFPAPDPAEWRLMIGGLVSRPQTLTVENVQSLPSVREIRRMKCVECWSARAKWEGFDLQALMGAVDPQPDAQWVHFFCADGYYESLSIEELSQDGVLFAYRMNDAPLPAKYGSPLRLVVPSKYGYKWPKAIVRLEFASDEKIGYWPTVGPYTSSGVILPGRDHPLDTPDGLRRIEGGEVIYPEDLEAQRTAP